jgi:hypothetical protein
MQGYYRFGPRFRLKAEWEDHVLLDKRPGCLFPDLLRKLTRLWEAGELNEWNRFDSAREAKLPRRLMPINAEPEPVTNPMERSFIDALMPPEVNTIRRDCLKRLEHIDRAVAAGDQEQLTRLLGL